MAKKFTAVTLDERLPGIHGLAPETPAKEVPRAKVPACNYSVEAGWTVEASKNCIGLRAECRSQVYKVTPNFSGYKCECRLRSVGSFPV
jgi:gamma-glutamyl:cysteine ligase YbdK (ATP-grasp superfamily)